MNSVKNSNHSLKGWYVVCINSLFGCAIGGAFSQYAMTVTELSKKLGIASSILLTGETVKSTSVIIAMLISGVVLQKIGLKKLCMLAILCFVIPQIAIPYTSNIILFFVLKAVQGMSTLIFPVFITTIIDWVDDKQVGLATAIFNGVFYSGAGIGAYISGIVISKINWIASYYVMAILGGVFGLIWLCTVKEKEKSIANIPQTKIEVKSDITYFDMLKNINAWLLVGIFLAYTWVLQTIAVNIPMFSETLGYDAENTGKIMTATAIGIIFSALVSGKISDFFASKSQNKFVARVSVISFGAVLIFTCALLMSFCDLSNFATFYIVCLLYSVGGAWGLGVFWSIVPELFKDKQLSLATGFIGGMGDCSMPIAPFVVGVVFGSRGLWNIGWLSSALMGVLSLICCLLVIKLSAKQKS